MSEAISTPEPGPMSVEQAVAALGAAREPEENNAAGDGGEALGDATDASQADEIEGDTRAPENAGEAEEPGDGEEAEQPDAEAEAEPLKPPQFWTKEEQEAFAQLDRTTQETLLRQEGKRESVVAKAKAEAAEEMKAARAQRQQVQDLAGQLQDFLPEALETFKSRWGDPDWEATIRQYGAEEAGVLKARYEREQAQLAQLQQVTQKARQEAHNAYVLEQFEALTQLNPELAPDVKDPRKGSEQRQAVTKYLEAAGVDRETIAQISAVQMDIAHKAMRWDEAQNRLKTAPKPKNPAPKAAPVRPGAAAAHTPAQRTMASAQGRFNQAPSIDNAVELLQARRAQSNVNSR